MDIKKALEKLDQLRSCVSFTKEMGLAFEVIYEALEYQIDEDIRDAAIDYLRHVPEHDPDLPTTVYTEDDIIQAFLDGAKWKHEEIEKNSSFVNATVEGGIITHVDPQIFGDFATAICARLPQNNDTLQFINCKTTKQ